LSKVIGSKQFQKDPTELGHAAQQNLIQTQNTLKEVRSECPARFIDFGFGWAARLNILGSGCAAIPKDIIICMINILNFIIINIINIIICIINIIFYYN